MRHKIPNSDFPISRAVEVPAGKTTVYLSGAVPPVAVEGADKNTVAAYGDTQAQTESVLTSIDKTLDDLGLKMGDVVKMQVFLVGDPAKDGHDGFRRLHGRLYASSSAPRRSRTCRRARWCRSPASPIPAFSSRSK